MIPQDFDLEMFLMSMAALVICVTIHEFAHAYSAWRAGDETPRLQGRLSLNPIDHLDPVGTFMMVVTSLSGFGLGWGKPVQVNRLSFRHPRWDDLRVSLWGPLSNLITAAVIGITLRFVVPAIRSGQHEPSQLTKNVVVFAMMIVVISIVLAVFNLLPIGFLDGRHILSALLPYEASRRYELFMAQYSMFIMLALFLGASQLGPVLDPPVQFLVRLFTGLSF